MKQSELEATSDEELVKIIERISEESSKCEATNRYNRLTQSWRQAWLVLKGRGQNAIRKLLPLLASPNPRVRLDVAKVCYSIAPEQCRPVIRELERMPKPSISVDAMIFLYDHDEEFRRQFSDDMDRRYGHIFKRSGEEEK